MSDKLRLFLAVNLSMATTRKIAEGVDRMRRSAVYAGRLRASWVSPANLHVTLKFLGWANPEVVPKIVDLVTEGLAGRRTFEVTARGVGAFPNERAARVLWVGLEDPAGELARLAKDVEEWMEMIGFPPESRPFSPHLTIARVKEGDGAEDLLAPYRGAEWGRSRIGAVVLYQSIMKSTGSEYTALATVPLLGDPGRTERQTREVREREDAADTEEPDEDHGGQQPA